MYQKSVQYLNRFRRVLGYGASAQFVLFGFRKNKASHSSRSPLIHSYGYASADDRTDYLALIRLSSEPPNELSGLATALVQYAGPSGISSHWPP
jgi:hypothetical protein